MAGIIAGSVVEALTGAGVSVVLPVLSVFGATEAPLPSSMGVSSGSGSVSLSSFPYSF